MIVTRDKDYSCSGVDNTDPDFNCKICEEEERRIEDGQSGG
jgi:hypothetical protein